LVFVKKNNRYVWFKIKQKMKKILKDNSLILLILGLGFILRIWGISFGLPDLFKYDEITHVEIALKLGSSGLNPGSFTHSSLMYYVLFCEYLVIYAFQYLLKLAVSPLDFLIKNYINNPSFIFFVSRITQAIFGTGIIALVYMTGKKLFNKRTGLIAAYLLSISFVHVQASHYIKSDILASFLLMIGFLYAVFILYKSDLKYYILAGFFVGLSMAAKYYALTGCIFLITAQLLLGRKFEKKFILCGFMVLIGFLAGQPYALLDYKNFISDSVFLLSVGNFDFIHRAIGQSRAVFFLNTLLRNAIGLPVLAAFLASICLMFRKGYSKKMVLVLSFPLFYGAIILFSSTTVDRYLCVMLPFLALSVSVVVDFLVKKIPLYKNALSAVCIIVLSLPITDVIRYEKLLTSQDTRTISKEWIERHLPRDVTFAIEGTGGNGEKLIIFGPNIKPDLLTLQDEYTRIIDIGGSGKLVSLKMEQARKDPGYPKFRLYKTSIMYKDFIEKHNPDYIILNSYLDNWDSNFDPSPSFNRSLMLGIVKAKYILAKEFKAYPEMKWDYHYQVDFDNLRKIGIFDFKQNIISGPSIYIYRRKGL